MALDPTEFASAMATYLANHDLSIALRRGLAVNLPSGLLQAEPFFSTDEKTLYIGNGDGTSTPFVTKDYVDSADELGAPLESPVFTGVMGVTAEQNISGVLSKKVGTSSMEGTSKVVSDAFITAETYVIIIPLSAPNGSVSVLSTTGSFTVTSTAFETFTFRWMAVK